MDFKPDGLVDGSETSTRSNETKGLDYDDDSIPNPLETILAKSRPINIHSPNIHSINPIGHGSTTLHPQIDYTTTERSKIDYTTTEPSKIDCTTIDYTTIDYTTIGGSKIDQSEIHLSKIGQSKIESFDKSKISSTKIVDSKIVDLKATRAQSLGTSLVEQMTEPIQRAYPELSHSMDNKRLYHYSPFDDQSFETFGTLNYEPAATPLDTCYQRSSEFGRPDELATFSDFIDRPAEGERPSAEAKSTARQFEAFGGFGDSGEGEWCDDFLFSPPGEDDLLGSLLNESGDTQQLLFFLSSTAPEPSKAEPKNKIPAKGWWKTEICKFWRQGIGCRNGSHCRWAHGEHELRFSCSDLDLPFKKITFKNLKLSTKEDDISLAAKGASLAATWDLVSQYRHELRNLRESRLIQWSLPAFSLTSQHWNELLSVLRKPNRENFCTLCHTAAATKPAPLAAEDDGAKDGAVHDNDGPANRGLNGRPAVEEARGMPCDAGGEIEEEEKTILKEAKLHESNGSTLNEFSVSCCQTCDEILHRKVLVLKPWLKEQNSLLSWSLNIASFLRECEDGFWHPLTSSTEVATRVLSTHWDHYKRIFARASVLMSHFLSGLEKSEKERLLCCEVHPGITLCQWVATSGNPVGFLVLYLMGFRTSSGGHSSPSTCAGGASPVNSEEFLEHKNLN